MAQGRLYEVDMRLRPSGTQGPVATSWASFTNYQKNDAWVWEHLALTRARTVAGDASLQADTEAFRREILNLPRDRAKVLTQVSDMRARLAGAKSPTGVWDTKTGPGRFMDIELLAQAGALLSSLPDLDVAGGLGGAVAGGWLSSADAATLLKYYDLFWSVRAAARLISGRGIDRDEMGQGAGDFLCRTTGYDRIGALQEALETGYARAAAIIDAALNQEKTDEG